MTELRCLEGIERLAAIGNTYYRGCYNIVTAIAVEGPLTEELVQRAVEKIQQKFECLNVEVVQDPKHKHQWKFKRISQLIKVEIIDRQYPDHWRAIWHELCSSQINGLAWRIIWLRDSNNKSSHFIAHFHHAIFDGTSMGIFFITLLQTLHRLHEGLEDTSFFQPIPPAAHRITGARWPLLALARFGYYHYSKKLRNLSFDPSGENVELRRWHTAFRVLEKNILEDLLMQCRQQSVKIGNALSAAFVLEAAEHIRQYELKPFNLSLCTTIDLRPHCLQKPLLPLIGTMIGAIHSVFRPNITQTLWEVARNVAKKIIRSKRRREDRNLSLLHTLFGPKVVDRQIHKNQGRPADGALVITNIGRVTVPDCGPFRATEAHATVSQAVWGSTLFLGFITINDRLCISLGYPFPSVSDVVANSLLDGVIQRLCHPVI